ncbi:MAG: hypothetical protein FWC13_07640 [Oscillospiraceae bacterium]|nr:hypothetical protein [Oscillospiraceae bacterium]
MATKSILKNVVIKDKKAGLKLAKALEQAGNKKSPTRQKPVSYSYASKEDVHKLFGSKVK